MTGEQLVLALTDILKSHCDAYEALCQLLSLQREALIAGDTERIHTLVRGQEVLLSQVVEAETRREGLHRDMARVAELEASVSLQEVLIALELTKETRTQLDRALVRLERLTEEAEMCNEENQRLIEHALQWIDHSFSEIQSLATEVGTYHKDAAARKASASILMDRSL